MYLQSVVPEPVEEGGKESVASSEYPQTHNTRLLQTYTQETALSLSVSSILNIERMHTMMCMRGREECIFTDLWNKLAKHVEEDKNRGQYSNTNPSSIEESHTPWRKEGGEMGERVKRLFSISLTWPVEEPKRAAVVQ